MRRVWLWFVVAAGCGRSGFEARTTDAPTDAMIDAGEVPIDSAVCNALLCDDFESGDFGKWSTVHIYRPLGTIDVTTTRPRSGTLSTEISIPPNPNTDTSRDLVLRVPTQTSGTIAVRAWFYLVDPLVDYNLLLVLRNKDTVQYVTAGGSGADTWVSSDNTAMDTLTDHNSATLVPPIATWFCFEFVFDFATPPGPGRVRIFVDETQVLDARTNDSTPAYSDIAIGAPKADSKGFSLFLDDVVIDNQRVGCQ
jgi:hypothetical protein